MILVSQVLVGLALLAPLQAMPSGWKEPAMPDCGKLHDALVKKTLRAGQSVGKMLDLGVPTRRRKLGPFTKYTFEWSNLEGMWLLAKDGRLRKAGGYSCTYAGTYFEDLTPEEEKQYDALLKRYDHVPYERCIGRFGWDRPPRRLWDPDWGAPRGE